MRYIKSILFIITSLLIGSCADQKGLKFEVFKNTELENSFFIDEVIELKGNILEVDTTLLRPSYLSIHHGNLVLGLDKEGNLIQKFSTSGKLINSFLPKGKGPNESMYVSALNTFVNTKGEETLFVMDKVLKKVHYYEPDSHKEFVIRNLYLEMVPLSDSLLIVQEFESDNRFGLLNLNDESIKSFGLPVEHEESKTNYILNQAFQGHGAISEDKSKFIFASKLTDRLEIYDLNDFSLISLTRGPVFYEPIFVEVDRGDFSMLGENEKGRFSYIDIDVGKNYFYLLFSGESREENPGKAHYGKQVFVVDYSGKIHKILSLDHPLIDFVVDEDNSIIYGVDLITYPDEKIIVYPFDN